MRLVVIFFLILVCSCNSDNELPQPINPDSEAFFMDGDIEIVFENDTENGINVIFLGDAYLQSDLGKTNGLYRRLALENIDFLFETEPFATYREHFNAYIVYVPSNEDVIATEESDTAFGSTISYTGPNNSGLLYISAYEKLENYVSSVTNTGFSQKNLILLSVNNINRGTAVLNGNIALFGNGYKTLMLHEVGHAFAGLGDEYYFENYTGNFYTDGIPNLDTTHNASATKWGHFVGLEGYEMVLTFQGGGYNQTGIWRPEFNSVMKDVSTSQTFNAPSREAIVKRIMQIKGLPYDFDEFLIKDQISLLNNRTTQPQTKSQNVFCDGLHASN